PPQAGAGTRRADMKGASTASFIAPGAPDVALARPRAEKLRRCIVAGVAAVVLSACAASPERTAWEVADARARWLDRFHLDERRCERQGGFIFQERHTPDALRLGPREPE